MPRVACYLAAALCALAWVGSQPTDSVGTAAEGIPVAESVDDIVQLASTQAAFQLDPARSPYTFAPNQTIAFPAFSSASVACRGSTLTACPDCNLLECGNGSATTLYDCNFNLTALPPPSSFTPSGLPAGNATTVNLLTGIGTITGNASLTLVRGSNLVPCQTLSTLTQLAGLQFQPFGVQNISKFQWLNDSAALTSLFTPIGYQGGSLTHEDVVVLCNNQSAKAAASASGRTVWPLLVALAVLAMG